MNRYGSLCDDFYFNMNLNTEMEVTTQRESVLSYFERVQKQFPQMQNFYCRDRHDYVLEEEKDGGSYRWCAVELRRVASGYVNPASLEAAMEQHRMVMELIPYMLSVSPLDCESMDLLYGFDFTYRGNQNQLVQEALGVCPAFEGLLDMPGARPINCEPAIVLALDEDCRMEARLNIETRTSAYQLRTGDFPEDQLSVYVNIRHYGSLPAGLSYGEMLSQLVTTGTEFVDNHVIDSVLQPLMRTISIK